MEEKEITPKDATIKISLRADSGYSCDMKGKIGLDQWEQINTIIDSGSCIATLQSELEKAKELLKKVIECRGLIYSAPFLEEDIDAFLNEGKK